jgi:putative ABC transport system permease protein
MIEFLVKGLIRDKHRSLFPIIVVSGGVLLTVWIYSWMTGVFSDMLDGNARFDTGHVKVVTKAYSEIAHQMPNDLALVGIDSLLTALRERYSKYQWEARIKFGGLLDVPDSNGETRTQGPVFGFALNLFGENSTELKRMNIEQAVVRGRAPIRSGEIVISDEFAKKLEIKIGESASLVSSTANRSMAVQNFIVVGTVSFGMAAVDRGAMIADLSDMQYALDMNNSAGEILGFSPLMFYDTEEAAAVQEDFMRTFTKDGDNFAPVMLTLEDQNDLRSYVQYAKMWGFLMVAVFVAMMSIVLWNAGLMSGIRRYGEVGVRLALGESKPHIYKTLLYESFFIGMVGSVIGTVFGIGSAYYLQVYGMDLSSALKGTSIMLSNVIRAKVTPTSFIIGFFPGLFGTFLGTALSGIGIFKRQTASLFKELEV